MKSPHRLPDEPTLPPPTLARLEKDFERFARQGLPPNLEAYLAETYGLDVATTYAGLPVKNPWGKASGQLSMRGEQVADDVEAGLGFVVLKTVIAQDASGRQAMEAWAIREAQMVAERIRGQSGAEGWTISWKGRGWWQSFDAYLELVRVARELGARQNTLIVPSCKYHLPTPDETRWKEEEYRYTTARLLDTYLREASGGAGPGSEKSPLAHSPTRSLATMPLEKDFSPTLAGSDRAAAQEKILEWLRVVPRLVREAADGWRVKAASGPQGNVVPSNAKRRTSKTTPRVAVDDASELPPSPVRIGLKLFNALFDDAFQVAMLEAVHEPGEGRPDFLVYCNRLFDPERRFGEHRGIAYGGPDLSDRNLRVLDAYWDARRARPAVAPLLEISATGDICSGKMAMEYALRGCANFQLHTLFQLPRDQYVMRVGNKTQKALHLLYFHPKTGLVAWMHHLAGTWRFGQEGPIRFRDIVQRAREDDANP